MTTTRSRRRALWRLLVRVGCLVVLAVALGPTAAVPAAADGWTPTAPLPTIGEATPLPDGRILFTGGLLPEDGEAIADARLYDPATGDLIVAAPMATGRGFHVAAPLPDGRVLVAGGDGGWTIPDIMAAAEVYDPATNVWTPAAPLREARGFFATATTLADGRVLVVGGAGGRRRGILDTAELYDPVTGQWAPAGTLVAPHYRHTATLLPDGRVLVIGGAGRSSDSAQATAELYDPTTNRWTAAAPLTTPRAFHTATLLPDGHVLVAGGFTGDGADDTYAQLATAELYDPAANAWTPTAPMALPRAIHRAVPLPSGQVLVLGSAVGEDRRTLLNAKAELYDPATGRWAPAVSPRLIQGVRAALPLLDGRVLVTGNYRPPDSPVVSGPGRSAAEFYDEGTPARQCFPETGLCLRGAFLTHWEATGGLAIHGLPLSDVLIETLEDGRPRTVQYFERSRLEYHPLNGTPYEVLLGQFGRRVLLTRTGRAADPPVEPLPDRAYFPETGHTVGGRFLDYWERNGGLAQFGLPLTEPFEEALEDGNVYAVQYFERARFEYHPENAPPYDVLLGQFGRRILEEARR